MTDIELFDALDPESWKERPLQKIFLMHNFDAEKSTKEEIRQTLFRKFKEWTKDRLHMIESMTIERFYEDVLGKVDGESIVPAIQVRFTLKEEFR